MKKRTFFVLVAILAASLGLAPVVMAQGPTPTPTPDPNVGEAPRNAVVLTQGMKVIPPWGADPKGLDGVDYPTILPGGDLPVGPAEAKTDFATGSPWRAGGVFTYTIPMTATKIYVAVQGDTPVELTWDGNWLWAVSSTDVTSRAPASIDGTMRPRDGSTGFSVVLLVN